MRVPDFLFYFAPTKFAQAKIRSLAKEAEGYHSEVWHAVYQRRIDRIESALNRRPGRRRVSHTEVESYSE